MSQALEGTVRAEGAADRSSDDLLAAALDAAWQKVPFYQDLWRATMGEPPVDTPAFEEWPTWGVDELREVIEKHPPYGNLYIEEVIADLAYVHSSTGTTGKPRMFPVAASDVPAMRQVYRRHMEMFGVRSDDLCCVTATLGLPRGAWSYLHAFEAVGAAVVPASNGRVTPAEKLLTVVAEAGVTVLQGTGSYLTYVTEKAKDLGIDPASTQVRMLISAGESVAPEVRRYLEQQWNAVFVMNFASTDLSWVAAECQASAAHLGRLGMHTFDDLLLAEILDEERQPCANEEYGELVVTSWVRPSTPRIRFRTGDRSALSYRQCECGRTSSRIMPIDGRIDEAVRFRGQTIWAASVEDVLCRITGGPVDFYLDHRKASGDATELVVVLADTDRARIEGLDIADRLRESLNVRFRLEFMAAAELTETTGVTGSGKTRRVLDRTRG